VSSDNITPPQISEERIAQMLLELNAHAKAEGPLEMFTIIVRTIEAERDRQWLEMLEPVAYLKEWDSVGGARKGLRRVDLRPECETWLENMFPEISTLYRIKEQG
jgi:hypothetical protein